MRWRILFEYNEKDFSREKCVNTVLQIPINQYVNKKGGLVVGLGVGMGLLQEKKKKWTKVN